MRTQLYCALLLLLLGCNTEERAEIQGTAKVGGKPIEDGSINFNPIDGTKAPSAGGSIREGKYYLSHRNGLKPGTFQVKLFAVRKTGKVTVNASQPNTTREEIEDLIPPEYGDKSKLKFEIKPGSNTYDIDIPR